MRRRDRSKLGWTAACVALLVLSCGETETKNPTNNATTTPNTNAKTNGPVTNTTTSCSCVWEGPVLFELTSVSRTPDNAYLVGQLSWQPCCEATSDAERVWVLNWDGTSEIGGPIPTSAEPVVVPADPEMPVIVESVDGQSVQLAQRASDSVNSMSLDIGDLVDTDASVLGDVTVDVSP